MPGMTPREEHLSQMVDRALDHAARAQARVVKTQVILTVLTAIEGRLARIEETLQLRPLPPPASARRQRLKKGADRAILALLTERGPLSATAVAQVIFQQDHLTEGQRESMRTTLNRLARRGHVVFDAVEKLYTLRMAPVTEVRS
jgi:hypothetical protein